jgi:MFS family permease
MKKNRLTELVNLNVYWIGLSFMWNSLHVLILPALLLNFVPDARKNSVLGLLTFFGLMIAMVVQPISGALSDRWPSRFGRRRPLIALGSTLDLLFLVLLAWAGSLPLVAVAYIGLQFTSNIAHGPAQGLMNDRVVPESMGLASGIKNLFDMSGLVVSSLVIGHIYAGGNQALAMGVIAGLIIASTLVTVLAVREERTDMQRAGLEKRLPLRGMLRVDIGAHPDYWRLIGSRLLFLIGVYGIQGFAQYFIRDTLRVDNPVQVTGDLLATIALSLIAFSILSGYLCDRVGRRPLHVAAAFLVAIGSVLMATAHTSNAILIFGSVVGMGIGIFTSANWALANDLAPRGEAGKYLGLTNLATAGASAIIRLAGPLIDWLNALRPSQNLGYVALFLTTACLALSSLILLRRVPDPVTEPAYSIARESGG